MDTPKTTQKSDLVSFINYGFRNFWKPKEIWFFSILPFLFEVILYLVNPNQTRGLISTLGSLISLILDSMCIIGILFIAYHYCFGKAVTTSNTIFGIRRFFWRSVGCAIVNGMILLPVLCILSITHLIVSEQSLKISFPLILIYLYIAAFSAFLYFPVFELFDKNQSIGKSLKNGNRIFGSNFLILALLGLTYGLVNQIWGIFSRLLTLIIVNGFTLATIPTFGSLLYNPMLDSNPLFLLINSASAIISGPLFAFVFISAYLNYYTPLVPEPIPSESIAHE